MAVIVVASTKRDAASVKPNPRRRRVEDDV